MVAVDGGGFGKVGDGAALGGLAGAVSADGIAQNAGGPDRTAVLIDRSHKHCAGQFLCGNTGDIPPVFSGSAAFQLEFAGEISKKSVRFAINME